ncbi:hypothetical protein AB0M02_28565 [Actinoplanes sp. NPDC051861]|uniref:hypothetical protein n=1 Tax=Actinoplanes sp. NPDC051861 TaxID=3155170 RepID=UPI00344041AF
MTPRRGQLIVIRRQGAPDRRMRCKDSRSARLGWLQVSGEMVDEPPRHRGEGEHAWLSICVQPTDEPGVYQGVPYFELAPPGPELAERNIAAIAANRARSVARRAGA